MEVTAGLVCSVNHCEESEVKSEVDADSDSDYFLDENGILTPVRLCYDN